MNLAPDEMQIEIGETARGFLADRFPITRVRKLAEGGQAIDEEGWSACAEMGWLSMLVPEAEDGLGLGTAEAVMVFREIGRHLTPGPLRSTMLAALLAALVGERELARSLSWGAMKAGLLVGDLAIDAGAGDLVLVIGREECALYEIGSAENVRAMDPGVRLSRVTLGAKRAAIGRNDAFLATAQIIVSAELLGVLEAVRDMSAGYAQTREQFGKPIGSFQAVKHRCADMAVAAYAVQSQLFMAAVRLDADLDDALFHASSAHVLAINFTKRSTADNIQNHGGIGVTEEHDCHLYLKRALLLELILGPVRQSFTAIIEPQRHEFY